MEEPVQSLAKVSISQRIVSWYRSLFLFCLSKSPAVPLTSVAGPAEAAAVAEAAGPVAAPAKEDEPLDGEALEEEIDPETDLSSPLSE